MNKFNLYDTHALANVTRNILRSKLAPLTTFVQRNGLDVQIKARD